MSSEKKEYPAVGATAPSAPTAYIGVPSAPGHQVTMATPYPAYPASAYTSPAYLPSSGPTYLPASYAAPLQHHLPYGTVSVAPNITAFGVPPTYLPQLTQVYSPRPGAVYVPAAATYDASARFDGHSMPVVPQSYMKNYELSLGRVSNPRATTHYPYHQHQNRTLGPSDISYSYSSVALNKPPPPGVAPNAAQLAMMQGNPVVLSQQKNSFLSGGSGAGFTFW